MTALVSIVIPVRNRASLLRSTIESLRQQTHSEWEALVVDDGSTPEQYEQIASTAALDRRVRLIPRREVPSGACACRNAGVAAARGEYILFLDSDDALAPNCLAHRLAAMAAHPAAKFIAFPSWSFRLEPGDLNTLWNVIDRGDPVDRLIRGDSPWQTSGPLWRRTALDEIGGWDVRLRTWQDSEFHIRAIVACGNYLVINEPDAFWRLPGEEGSIGKTAQLPSHVVNRARMLLRTGAWLNERRALTEPRRRSVSMQLFRHAFRTPLARRRSMMLWRHGRTLGLVRFHEYWLALFFDGVERVGRRFALSGLTRLYPNLNRYGADAEQ